ncbi:MAG: hypothetical protein LBS72_07285 [Oscillospiraceae bacterium]|jgi:hypothetical protein|nr:hypothetical protein [Oscillospiraceae bacterium]
MVKIGRPINGISLNGLEYVLAEKGYEMIFADKSAALEFLRGQGYAEDDIENEDVVFSEIPQEAEDKFYLDRESGAVRWLYYNPDSDAGGQYVENVFDYDLIREAADAENFFDQIGGCSKQYLIDVGTDDFAGYDEMFKTVPGDFNGCTGATQTALVAAANAALTEGRTLITKENIEIDRELFIEDNHINAYIAAWFDVDARFGTQTHDTDDYINVYANYFPEIEELEVGYTLINADGSDSDFVAVELADSEREAILAKLREAGLDECVAEMQSDADESEGMTMT